MLPKWITNVLKWYTMWCFYSMPFDSIGNKCVNLLIFLIHMGSCTWSSFNSMKIFFEAIAVVGFLDALNVFLYFLICIGTYWLIIYDCYSKRRFQHKFWMICERINERFCSFDQMQKSKCLTILIVYSIVDVIICLVSIVGENVTSTSNKLLHYEFINVIDQRVSFYMLHAKFIEFQLQKINAELITIRHCERFSVSKSIRGRNFKWIRNYYELVFNMCNCMNATFGWSHLAIILMTFYSNAAFLNSAYSQSKQKWSAIEGVYPGKSEIQLSSEQPLIFQ